MFDHHTFRSLFLLFYLLQLSTFSYVTSRESTNPGSIYTRTAAREYLKMSLGSRSSLVENLLSKYKSPPENPECNLYSKKEDSISSSINTKEEQVEVGYHSRRHGSY